MNRQYKLNQMARGVFTAPTWWISILCVVLEWGSPLTLAQRTSELEALSPTNMVFIPPGNFLMGSPTNELDRLNKEGIPGSEGWAESPQTRVTISQGFWMGKYEVTQEEYRAIVGINQDQGEGPGRWAGVNRPVDLVSWFDAMNYCELLTRREQSAGRIPGNTFYRLPTEAEWEYACRAGTSTRFSHGDDPDYTKLADYAWYAKERSDLGPARVGTKLPNPWGLHDMHGNVWEWCVDSLGQYPGGSVIDPQGPPDSVGSQTRGGASGAGGDALRSARRWDRERTIAGNAGFRVVLSSIPKPVLNVNRVGKTLMISWRATMSGTVLESTSSFLSPSWHPVPALPVLIGDKQVVAIDIDTGTAFFHLRNP